MPLAGSYFCPHHPEGQVPAYAVQCSCRKPQPGLLLQAAQAHRLNLARSWFVGDILDDIEAGRRAGCRTILLDNGNETEWVLNPDRQPHYYAASIDTAAGIILAEERCQELGVRSQGSGIKARGTEYPVLSTDS